MSFLKSTGYDQPWRDNKTEEFGVVNNRMRTDGIHTITKKFQVGEHDLYLKTGWVGAMLVMVDITIGNDSRHGSEDHDLSMTRHGLSRVMIEVACKNASMMLQSGVFSPAEVLGVWSGMEGFPSGYCPQTNTLQRGTLHAAAMIIGENFKRWQDIAITVEGRRRERCCGGK